MKHVIKPRLWETMWSAQLAVLYLLLNGEQLREAGELATTNEAENYGWIKGQKTVLMHDEVLRKVAPHLSQVFSRLDDQMREYKLTSDFMWPPSLWLRSFKVLEFPIQPHAMPELKRWQVSSEAKGTYFLYTYWNAESGKFLGPRHELTGMFGRTALELAVDELPKKIASKAHALEWKMEAHTITTKKKDVQLATDNEARPKNAKQLPRNEVKTEKNALLKPRKSGKRRNINTLRMRYGSACVMAVQEALEHYVALKGSNITNRSPDNRPYSSTVGKLELMEFLQGKYKEVREYSVSTLKPVLGHFVQTPRGRPPTLVELSERNYQVVKKVQRNSR